MNLLHHSLSQPALWLAAALLLAWAWDAVFGEPRNAFHPVAWMGRVLWPLGCWLRVRSPGQAFIGGVLAWFATVGVLGTAAWYVQQALLQAPPWWAVLGLAVLIKPTFAWRMLRTEVAAVEAALAQGMVPARERLARLVSRDVSRFDVEEIRESAISTLAENLNDSVIAPLFWFAVAGLPGAVIYRAVNTMDAMWGYRGVWEWAGKWAAWADDVMSWIPARLTALLLWPDPSTRGWGALGRQAFRTPSPNSGWPMGAMALRLGVRLSKPGVYVLNEKATPPGAKHMVRAQRLASGAAWVGVGLAVLAWLARSFW